MKFYILIWGYQEMNRQMDEAADERKAIQFGNGLELLNEDQLVTILHQTIEFYTHYRTAISEEPARDAAIVEVLQGLKADKELARLTRKWGTGTPRTLQE